MYVFSENCIYVESIGFTGLLGVIRTKNQNWYVFDYFVFSVGNWLICVNRLKCIWQLWICFLVFTFILFLEKILIMFVIYCIFHYVWDWFISGCYFPVECKKWRDLYVLRLIFLLADLSTDWIRDGWHQAPWLEFSNPWHTFICSYKIMCIVCEENNKKKTKLEIQRRQIFVHNRDQMTDNWKQWAFSVRKWGTQLNWVI